MRIMVQGGVEVDLASTEEMSSLFDDATDKIVKSIPKAKRKPIIRRIAASVVSPTNVSVDILSFRGPAPGYTWEITHAVVMGSDASTVVAGASAAIYIGSPQAFGLGQLAWTGQAVPSTYNIGGGTLFAQNGEDVFLAVTGAAMGANLAGVLTVLQHVEELYTAGGM